MKIFFDESGNSGCVTPNKNGNFFDDGQRFFVLAGVIAKNREEEESLSTRYKLFKKAFSIENEIKGSDLLTKGNNKMLDYFISNLIDSEHFYVCIYDKFFYLATLVCVYLFGYSTRNTDPLLFYTQASALALENPEFFKCFCDAVEKNTDKAKMDFLEYIITFQYKHIDKKVNGFIVVAQKMLENGDYGEFPLPYGCYLNEKITHLINLTALGESLLAIKLENCADFGEVTVIHDKIHEFEQEFRDTLSSHEKIKIEFEDSKKSLLVQYADNVAGIFRKAFEKTVGCFRIGEQWKSENKFFPELLAKLLKNISIKSCKFDTQICDNVLALCVRDIFDTSFPIKQRNNIEFYKRFAFYKKIVLNNIATSNYDVSL